MKKINLKYFAAFRDETNTTHESILTTASDVESLYEELNTRYTFTVKKSDTKIAINQSYANFKAHIKDGDEVVFIPPVAGG